MNLVKTYIFPKGFVCLQNYTKLNYAFIKLYIIKKTSKEIKTIKTKKLFRKAQSNLEIHRPKSVWKNLMLP